MTSISSSKQSTDKSKPATLTWEIDNFNNLSSSATSVQFSAPNDDKLKFQLYLYPKSKSDFFGNTTSVFLYLTSSTVNAKFHFSICIINANGDKCFKQEATLYYANACHNMCGQVNFWNEYLRDTANGLLVNGKLTIYCEVNKIENNELAISGINSYYGKQIKISEDFKSLLESENFSDTVLAVGKKEFRVHKAILAARSSVFKAMFEHECEEKKQNRVEIIDLDVDVCEEFLRYIYTGNVTSLDRFAPELMASADKYQLDELKSICGEYLAASLDNQSVTAILQLADMHKVEQLKSKCIDYIIEHAKAVQNTEGWKKLMTANPELGYQLFLNVVNRK